MSTNVLLLAHTADRAIAQRVQDRLEQAGFAVTRRDENYRDWPGGQTVREAVEANDVVIVLLSPEARDTHIFADVTGFAMSRQVRVIPVVVRGEQEDAVPPILRRLMALVLGERDADAVLDQLVTATRRLLGGAGFPAGSAPAAPLAPLPAEEAAAPEVDDLLADLDEEAPVAAREEARRERRKPSKKEAEEQAELAPPPPPQPAPAPAPEPEPAAGASYGAPPARPAGAFPSVLPAYVSEPPQFTAYYPAALHPGKPYALMAFAHVDSFADHVRQIAANYREMMGGEQASASDSARTAVDIGSRLTFVPRVPGLSFTPAEQVITWQPPYQSALFAFSTPDDLPAELTGQVFVYQGPLIIGEIPVTLRRAGGGAAESTAPDTASAFKQYLKIFTSYSHRDAIVMEYFRKRREGSREIMVVDKYTLKPGEYWEERLYELIDECDVFELFWSRHSAGSRFCRQEWEYALRYQDERPRFVQPVYWRAPIYEPLPDRLGRLHFQQVTLPPLTRLQLAAAQVRSWFRRGGG